MSWELRVIAKALRAAAQVLEAGTVDDTPDEPDRTQGSTAARKPEMKHRPRPLVRVSIPAETKPSDIATQRAKALAKRIGLIDKEEGT